MEAIAVCDIYIQLPRVASVQISCLQAIPVFESTFCQGLENASVVIVLYKELKKKKNLGEQK